MENKKENNFISLVVYIYNNEDETEKFFDSVLPVVNKHFNFYEIICVNDASTDNSLKKIKEYFYNNKSDKMIQIIQMSSYHGRELAMNAGRDLAIGDFVYEFDYINVDYNSECIYDVYKMSSDGYDVVSASPSKNVSIQSKLFYSLYNSFEYSNKKLKHETFRIISRRAINRVKSSGVYVPYRKIVYNNCGLATSIIEYNSNSKMRKKYSKNEKNSRINLAVDSVIYFTNLIEKISQVLSAFFLIISLGVALYVFYSIFSVNRPLEGWISIMGFMSFGFVGTFILLTAVLRYLSSIIKLNFKKQYYFIESVDKIDEY